MVVRLMVELGFAWHHSKQPKHARADFEDMLARNCNSVLIAASEDDIEYWYPNLVEIIEEAKNVGLRVWLNFWAFGGVFGGEPPSMFLHQNHSNRQITAESKMSVPAACINRKEFRDYFLTRVREVVSQTKTDGVFIDEPHFYPVFDMSEFTCTCDVCQTKYQEQVGAPMPTEYDKSVRAFREQSMHDFLVDICKTVKQARKGAETCVCVIPETMESMGTPDWDRIASIREVDMFSTDPYFSVFGEERPWALEVAKRTIDTARKYRKRSQLWLQMFRLPSGQEKAVASLVPEYAKLGVDSIFGWCYLANKGTTIASDEPELLWDLVTQEYKKLRK
jgi:hypothetical protein